VLLASITCLSACTTAAVSLTAPSPTGETATQCGALITSLRGSMEMTRRVSPPSSYTLAWGNPVVTLRCGVDAPTPSQADSFVQIGAVEWRVRQVGDSVLWTSRGRVAAVEVRVSMSDKAQERVLSRVNDAVLATIPASAPTPASAS